MRGSFKQQLSGAALENSFGELLWGTGLKHSSFGATAFRRCFGEQLWEAAAGNRIGGQLCRAGLGSTDLASFPEQLCQTIALKNNSFGNQLSVAILGRNFREPLCRVCFGEPFWRLGLQNRSFGATALEKNFGAQLWGVAAGNSCGQLSGLALRQLREAWSNGNFGEEF